MMEIDTQMLEPEGVSVTQRIKQIKQPRGGYIKPKELNTISFGEGIDELLPDENIQASLIGLAVDYMTRFLSGSPVEDAFQISLIGASIIGEWGYALQLLNNINGLDRNSIINAIKVCGYDVCYRANILCFKPVDEINPNNETIQNVRTMVERSLQFFQTYGPKMLDGFTFEGGYTETVNAGDGDFTTSDTLWDFKVSKARPKKEHTLQILMYWRMGLHSIHHEFQNIKRLGIYNPRLNEVYTIDVKNIPINVIEEVDRDVIGYH